MTVIYWLWFSPVIAFVFQKRKRKCTERTGATPGQEVGFSPMLRIWIIWVRIRRLFAESVSKPRFCAKKKIWSWNFVVLFRQKRNKATNFLFDQHKGLSGSKRSLQPSNKNLQLLKHDISYFFLFVGHFCLSGSSDPTESYSVLSSRPVFKEFIFLTEPNLLELII
jgi:hypothetical protein